MTMADFDSLFADNLRDFQPIMMQAQYTGRDSIGRARSSGSLDRSGRSSSAGIHKSQPRASSLQSHRRQHSGGTSTLNFATGDPFNEINMSEMWTDHGISPNGSPGPIDSVPLQSDQLLSFRSFQRNNFVMLNQWDQPVGINVAAQLHGMFFLAESPWDANSGPSVPGSATLPKELTCYRRNLFQVSGSIHLPAVSSVIVSENETEITAEDIQSGQRRVIQSLEATIGGIENVEHNAVKIITVPWKNAATAPATAASQSAGQTAGNPDDYPSTAPTTGRPMEKEPAPLSFNYPAAYYANPNGIQPEDDEADSLKWQMNWKRLQFRSATANNGRRKDLQQHFLVKVSVYANLVTEDLQGVPTDKVERVLLCEAFSGAIIVRGRSPRNFSSRNDIPLTGSAIVSSRHSHNNANAQITSAAKKARHMSSGSQEEETQSDMIYTPDFAGQYADYPILEQSFQIPNDMNFDYAAPTGWMDASSSLSMLQSPTGMMQQQQQNAIFDPNGSYTNLSDPSGSRVNLSGMMYSDEFSPAATQTMFSQSMPATTMGAMAPPSLSHRLPRPTNSMESPSMDLLYEYFPIGVDDYMPPVEVVYRPHNAHHLTQAPPSKSSGRSKRLFSETPFE
ncbi:hypothetical protein TWF506_001612 [Arthrobotrys conoides]|uniref:NDT80 domain-containing protein n=1 Tax=Arthrobotrys conoides TaxID=74498 RepID=A0AAN8NZP2_9PEZI